MKKLIFFSIALMNCLGLCAQKVLVNGVSWYDDRDSIVSAHAGSVIHNEDSNTFYLFGEYKTDSANVFNGFSCYSSTDFVNWKWEGLALPPQRFGRMSRTMIGERPKVIRCAATGEYIMLMHSDNRSYTDPAVLYATSKTLVGPYTLQGPLLFEEKPIKQGGIAAFVDDDGKGYLIDNKGEIYRLSSDFHYAEDKICQSIAGMGVGPSIIHQNGLYYLFCSNNTGWDSNDNFYYTAADLTGPWTPRGIFARKGTNTWDSQVGNVFMLRYEGLKIPLYMGDRWSFPRQHSAATYVWLPMHISDEKVSITDYWKYWNPLYDSKQKFEDIGRVDSSSVQTVLSEPGKELNIIQRVKENGRIAVSGKKGPDGGYGDVVIFQTDGWKEIHACVDFYSKNIDEGVVYISDKLPKGIYKVTVRCNSMKSQWTGAAEKVCGSKGNKVEVSNIYVISE